MEDFGILIDFFKIFYIVFSQFFSIHHKEAIMRVMVTVEEIVRFFEKRQENSDSNAIMEEVQKYFLGRTLPREAEIELEKRLQQRSLGT